MSEREKELEEAGIQAARAARSLLAGSMTAVPAELHERCSEVVNHLFAAEVGGLDRVTRALTVACAALQELTYEDGAAPAFAHALTILYPISRELNRQSGPPVAISAADPILLVPSKKKTTLTPDDRRRVPRVDLEVDIGMHSDTNFYAGFSGDVSTGGVFVATYRPLAVGTQTKVSFVLPGGHHVITDGEVTWVRDPVDAQFCAPGMGVRFVSLSAEDRQKIVEFAQAREPMIHDE